jgi:polyisoprenoid-binding protein YceI
VTPQPSPPSRRNTIVALFLAVALLAIGGAAAAYVLVLRGSQVAPLALDTAVPGTSSGADASSGASTSSIAPGGSPAVGAADLPGTWVLAADSVAGYRVREQLANLDAESDAVGRTSAISGQAVIGSQGADLVVSDATFSVDLTQLQSDDNRRDGQLSRQGIETAQFPTATFKLTQPVTLPADAPSGAVVNVSLTGDLTLHGVTKQVSIPVQAQLQGSQIQVVGSYTFPWGDFGMQKPTSFSVLSVADQATLEFKLLLAKGS